MDDVAPQPIFDVELSEEFTNWLKGLRDRQARARIIVRLERVREGNFGDHKTFDGIGELRFHFGPGYRAYYLQVGNRIIVLLTGGDKSSQARDIDRALKMAKAFGTDDSSHDQV